MHLASGCCTCDRPCLYVPSKQFLATQASDLPTKLSLRPPFVTHPSVCHLSRSSPAVFILYWDCPFPHPTATYYVIYIGSMLLLFLNFFISKYYSDAKKAAVAKKEKEQAAKLAAESKKDI